MINYKFKSKPYAHQLKALERSWDKENFAYFMEMGTGKSKVLVDNIAMLYELEIHYIYNLISSIMD